MICYINPIPPSDFFGFSSQIPSSRALDRFRNHSAPDFSTQPQTSFIHSLYCISSGKNLDSILSSIKCSSTHMVRHCTYTLFSTSYIILLLIQYLFSRHTHSRYNDIIFQNGILHKRLSLLHWVQRWCLFLQAV
jgi:hypothetical protein